MPGRGQNFELQKRRNLWRERGPPRASRHLSLPTRTKEELLRDAFLLGVQLTPLGFVPGSGTHILRCREVYRISRSERSERREMRVCARPFLRHLILMISSGCRKLVVLFETQTLSFGCRRPFVHPLIFSHAVLPLLFRHLDKPVERREGPEGTADSEKNKTGIDVGKFFPPIHFAYAICIAVRIANSLSKFAIRRYIRNLRHREGTSSKYRSQVSNRISQSSLSALSEAGKWPVVDNLSANSSSLPPHALGQVHCRPLGRHALCGRAHH